MYFTKESSKRIPSTEKLFEHFFWVSEVERMEAGESSSHVEVVVSTPSPSSPAGQAILAVPVVNLTLFLCKLHRMVDCRLCTEYVRDYLY